MELPLLDISVVTYNSQKHLPKLIDSILRQDMDLSRLTLLFYDNASPDDSVDTLRKLLAPHQQKFRGIRLVEGKENLGFGRAHNASLSGGNSEFALFLNPDAELATNCLSELLSEARREGSNAAAWEARQIPYEHPKIYNPITMEVPWSSAACLMVRREAFDQVGGFDRHIFLYGEDVDLSWRLQDSCGPTLYVPKAVVVHNTYSEPNETKPAQLIGSVRANLYLRTRHGSWGDIGRGILMHLGMLFDFTVHRSWIFRAVMMKGLLRYPFLFLHYRNYGVRRKKRTFLKWDYAPIRLGAFYDCSRVSSLKRLPKVSVLIRTIGRTRLLSQALATLANQTYPNLEIVVVEDGPDTLQDFLSRYENLDIQYRALDVNRGRCVAGNLAMSIATGEYWMFLDEDDLLYADHVEQLVMAVVSKNESKVAYSYAFEVPTVFEKREGLLEVVEEGKPFSRFREPFSFLRLLHHNYLPIHTVLFHRSLYEECGGFDLELENNEDWNLWVRFAIRNRPFICVPKTTALYRVPLGSNDHQKRYERLVYYQELARKKQSELTVTMTIGEIVAQYSDEKVTLGLRETLKRQYPGLERVLRVVTRLCDIIRRIRVRFSAKRPGENVTT